ncbi:MAG TPA: S8 family serine peptidase, partial [Longimicrobium sp.]
FGTAVAVVDWGLDYTHVNFRHGDGRTRLLALWDQTAPYRADRPNRYGYGVVHTAADIDRALAAERPDEALGYDWRRSDPDDSGAHGTHVMDIAAGNGRVGPAGVAPEAELIFVHLASRALPGQAALGDSVCLLEAVDFIFRTAGDRPVCINTSMGRQMGSHDGTSLVEQAFDAALTGVPGRFIGQSTGNYYDRGAHASGQLRPGQVLSIPFLVGEADVTPNELEVWYPGRDVLGVQVRAPTGEITRKTGPDDETTLTLGGHEACRVYHRAREPNNLDNTIHVYLYAGAPPGRWELVLTGDDVVDGRFNAWIERDAGCSGCQARFEAPMVVALSTTGSIANGFRPVAVGAYDAHDPERRLGRFSSAGPTRDGRIKPDLVAPGVNVLAARSAPRQPDDGEPRRLVRKSGTSMAAPHVTGTVALMFQAAGRKLHIQEVRNLLLTSTRPADLAHDSLHRVGSGYLDTDAAIAATRAYVAGGAPAPRLAPAPRESAPPAAETARAAIQSGSFGMEPVASVAESSGAAWPEESPPGSIEAMAGFAPAAESIEPASFEVEAESAGEDAALVDAEAEFAEAGITEDVAMEIYASAAELEGIEAAESAGDAFAVEDAQPAWLVEGFEAEDGGGALENEWSPVDEDEGEAFGDESNEDAFEDALEADEDAFQGGWRPMDENEDEAFDEAGVDLVELAEAALDLDGRQSPGDHFGRVFGGGGTALRARAWAAPASEDAPWEQALVADDIRKAIQAVAILEAGAWRAGGNILFENVPGQMGHLVRYWLATAPEICPDTLPAVQKRALAIGYPAAFFTARPGSGPPKAALQRARQDLLTGVAGAACHTALHRIVEGRLTEAFKAFHDDKVPWSAAFIMACARAVAIDKGLESVATGVPAGGDALLRITSRARHLDYIAKAKGRTTPLAYRAFAPADRVVAVGDIVVMDRAARRARDVISLGRLPEGGATHGDIVVQVDTAAGIATAVGGNLGDPQEPNAAVSPARDSVRFRRFPLTAEGKLRVEAATLYEQEKNAAGTFQPVVEATPLTGDRLARSSTGRIFGVLSLNP